MAPFSLVGALHGNLNLDSEKPLKLLCGRGSCSFSTRSVAWVPLGRVAVLAPGPVLGLPKLTLGGHQRLPHSPPKMLPT